MVWETLDMGTPGYENSGKHLDMNLNPRFWRFSFISRY